jgi:hypothetical protein
VIAGTASSRYVRSFGLKLSQLLNVTGSAHAGHPNGETQLSEKRRRFTKRDGKLSTWVPIDADECIHSRIVVKRSVVESVVRCLDDVFLEKTERQAVGGFTW